MNYFLLLLIQRPLKDTRIRALNRNFINVYFFHYCQKFSFGIDGFWLLTCCVETLTFLENKLFV
jgi:hypothetical protein